MKRLGIIGGGQLARFLTLAAYNLGITTQIYCASKNEPAAQVSPHVTLGNLDDRQKILEFANSCSVITYEVEHLDAQILFDIENKHGNLSPSARSIVISQDRISEKEFVYSLPISKECLYKPFYRAINNHEELNKILIAQPSKYILKARRGGYDGRNQWSLQKKNEIDKEVFKLLETNTQFILEEKIEFDYETSLTCVRGKDGQVEFFPMPINYHEDGILRRSVVKHETSKTPAKITIENHAKKIAEKIASELGHIGVLTIEFFVDRLGRLIFNEIAPRVHNSCHWSQDVCNISQFEAHVRAVMGLPIVPISLFKECEMFNILGDEVGQFTNVLSKTNYRMYLYGKEGRYKRKMGHFTVIALT